MAAPAPQYSPPPVSAERMADGLTAANLATAITVRSMPEERRLIEAKYRCKCGSGLHQVADHMIEAEGRHLHLLAYHCPHCGCQCGVIFDVTAAVALLPPAEDGGIITPEEERRAAELGAYYLLDKAPQVRSDAARNTLVNGLLALGPNALGALRYSLRDVSAEVVSLAARVIAVLGDTTDLRRLKAVQASPNASAVGGLDDSVTTLRSRLEREAKEQEMVWRPSAI